jgi:hypothetical protein
MARRAVLQGPGRALCSPGCPLPPSAQQSRAAGSHHAASGMPPRNRCAVAVTLYRLLQYLIRVQCFANNE